ncbi:hypothetical protein BH09ACT8_BH09ACT8_46690 [soil metagenome]
MEQVPISDVAYGDVVQDPKSGKWLTVTRIVAGDVTVDGRPNGKYLAFYGDERLNEQIVFDDPDGMVNRKSG